MSITLGVALHWTEDISADEVISRITSIEELGYDQFWISNEKFFWDMNTIAGIAATHTNRMEIGTFVTDPYSVHPALSAMFINTLDKISGGRAVMVIGAGGTGFPVMGIKRTKPARAIKEAVLVMRGLLDGKTIDFQGEVIQCNRGRLNVRSRSDIKIIVASRGDMVFRVGGEIADGVMISTYAEPVGIGYAIQEIEKGAQRAGRKLDDVTMISRVDACISQDRQQAINAVKPMLGVSLWNSYPDRTFVHRVGLTVPDEVEKIIEKRDYNLMVENSHLIPDEFVDKFCWAGTADEVAQKVAAVARMGITNITFLPHPPSGGSVLETIQNFANVVRPMVDEMLKS